MSLWQVMLLILVRINTNVIMIKDAKSKIGFKELTMCPGASCITPLNISKPNSMRAERFSSQIRLNQTGNV